MRALTIRQPWASLIALGEKTIETRGWSTRYRGPLAIHAGTSPATWDALDAPSLMSKRDTVQAVLAALGVVREDGSWPSPSRSGAGIVLGDVVLPLGAVVATCTLVDVVPMVLHPLQRNGESRIWTEFGKTYLVRTGHWKCWDLTETEVPYGDFTPGRFAWLLDDVKPCEPIPYKGRLGLWEPNAALLDLIEATRG